MPLWQVEHLLSAGGGGKIDNNLINSNKFEALEAVRFVEYVSKMVREYKSDNVGIFGVNGMGSLMACNHEKINFIVDEDEGRQKMLFGDRKIVSPNSANGDILLAFRNKDETNKIYKVLCEKYPNKTFINLCKDFI